MFEIRSCSQAVHSLDYVGERISGRWGRTKPASARLYSLGLVVPSAVAGIADASLTLVGTVAAIVTLGTQPKINGLVFDLGNGSKRMLREPYAHFNRSINLSPWKHPPDSRVPLRGLTAETVENLYRIDASSSCMNRHVKPRLHHIVRLVCMAALLIFNVVKFVFAFVFSLLALRKSENLNRWTFEALIFPRIIHDVCIFTILAINPQAKFNDHTLSDVVFGNLTRHGLV